MALGWIKRLIKRVIMSKWPDVVLPSVDSETLIAMVEPSFQQLLREELMEQGLDEAAATDRSRIQTVGYSTITRAASELRAALGKASKSKRKRT